MPTTETLTGTEGDDTLTATLSAPYLIEGLGGNDSLTGEDYSDSLEGGDGNDTLFGGPAGLDTLVGGAGDDIYWRDFEDVIVEAADSGIDLVIIGWSDYAYTLPDNVENLTWWDASWYVPTGTGNALDNVMQGARADIRYNFSGLGGNDSLVGMDQADTLSGGDGNDTLDGGAGNDSLSGGDGNDALSGGAGNDTLTGGTGTDTLTGGAGDDHYWLGDGLDGDVVVEAVGGGADTVHIVGVDWNMASIANIDILDGHATAGQALTFTGSDASERIVGVIDSGSANFSMTGGGGNDTLVAAGGNDTLDGGAGNDSLQSGAGNDSLVGGDGNDTLDAGSGSDTLAGGAGDDVYYFSIGSATVTEYAGEGVDSIHAGGDFSLASVAWQYFENGYSTVDAGTTRTLLGNDAANVLDVQVTSFGEASLLGADSGRVSLDGGAGNDTIRVIDHVDGYGTYVGWASGSLDTLLGGDGDDFLSGGSGGVFQNLVTYNFYQYGDSLSGGTGNDTLIGGGDDDTLDGGDGNDLLDAGGAVGHGRITDYFTYDGFITPEEGIGNTLYGGLGNDTLISGAGSDLLQGGDGKDSLDGGAGGSAVFYDVSVGGMVTLQFRNTLEGGAGDDTYVLRNLGTYSDVIIENAGEGNDTVVATIDYTLAIENIENIRGQAGGGATRTVSGNGDANIVSAGITTGTANFVLSGGDGDDTVTGAAYADTLSGGTGNDSLSGGGGDDSLSGGIADDTLLGGAGNDTLAGGWGNDRVWAGADNDLISGDSGNDVLGGGAGNDTSTGGTGNDELYGSDGNDSLAGDDGNDSLWGDLGDDTLEGGAGNDSLDGVDGADLLRGGTGIDTLLGGAGNDTLVGGWGSDTLSGQAGADTFFFQADFSSGADTVTDFVSGTDVLQVARSLTNLQNTGTLMTYRFQPGSAASDVNDRFIFDGTTGNLYYDADGSNAGAQVLVATLSGVTSITASDIVIYDTIS